MRGVAAGRPSWAVGRPSAVEFTPPRSGRLGGSTSSDGALSPTAARAASTPAPVSPPRWRSGTGAGAGDSRARPWRTGAQKPQAAAGARAASVSGSVPASWQAHHAMPGDACAGPTSYRFSPPPRSSSASARQQKPVSAKPRQPRRQQLLRQHRLRQQSAAAPPSCDARGRPELVSVSSSGLEEENRALRALAEKMRFELAAIEARSQMYQHAADLLSASDTTEDGG